MKKILLTSFFLLLLPLSASASVSLGQANLNALSSGLVGYWPLDGDTTNWTTNKTNDVSGQGNTGQMISMSTSTSPVQGKIGGAMKFDGSASYVDVTGSGSLHPTGAMTVSGWFKGTVTDNHGSGIGTFGSGSTRGYSLHVYSSTNVEYCVASSSSTVFCRDVSGINNPAVWALYTMVYVPSVSMTLYKNGVQVDQTTTSVPASQTSSADFIMGKRTDLSSFFGGAMDDVRINNRALSAQEIALLYAAGQANVGHSNTVALSSGLMGYWNMDGSSINWTTNKVTDVSGTGNTGQMISMSTSTSPIPGKIGQALRFDGTGYIDIGNVGAYTSNFSISLWLKQNVTPAAEASVIEKRNAQTAGWAIGISSSNNLIWRTFNGGGQFNITGNGGGFTMANAVWYHVVIVHTSGSATIYVNGVDRTLTHSITDPAADTTATRIAFQNGGSTKFNGLIDDVRVYNRALSVQEVKDLYALGATNIAHSNTVALSSGLTAYWSFDGSSINWTTNKVTDVSGNGNTGQMISMSTSTSPVAGKIGQAMKFTGSAQDITTGKNVSTLCSTSTCTMAVWVYPTGATTVSGTAYGGQGIVADDAGNMGIYRTSIGGNDFIWAYNWDGSEKRAGVAYSTNTWTHIVFVHSGGVLYEYKNGVFATSTASGTQVSPGSITIDRGYTPTNAYFSGKLDDVRIYNRALSAQEIYQLYQLGK